MTFQRWRRYTGFGARSVGVSSIPAAEASSWTAPAVSGLVSIWRADLGVTTSGSNVTGVEDQVGSNNLVNNGTVPFNATAMNGHPAFAFVGTGALKATAFPMGTGSTGSWYCVAKMNTATADNGGLISYRAPGAFGDYENDGSAVLGRSSNTSTLIATRDSVNTSPEAAISLDTYYRVLVVWDGTNQKLYINNVEQATASMSGRVWVSAGAVRIGAREIDVTEAWYWYGPVSEVGISTSAFDSTERSTLDTYLSSGPNGWD
jgi:hypothetical protein